MTSTTNTTNVAKPKHTVTIRFTVDKRGKQRAHYWGLARRWLPIGIDEAHIRIAMGLAVKQEAA